MSALIGPKPRLLASIHSSNIYVVAVGRETEREKKREGEGERMGESG